MHKPYFLRVIPGFFGFYLLLGLALEEQNAQSHIQVVAFSVFSRDPMEMAQPEKKIVMKSRITTQTKGLINGINLGFDQEISSIRLKV